MHFVWDGQNLDGAEGKEVALFRNAGVGEVYRGILSCDEKSVPYVRGFRVIGNRYGNEAVIPLQKGDVYAFLE